jgi:hypothetical protein
MSINMPLWKCHKVVRALKIRSINANPSLDDPEIGVGATMYPEDGEYAPFPVGEEFMLKHQPIAPGYFVVYEDGYESWSPVTAFEKGYSLLDGDRVGFGEALEAMKSGFSVQRDGWNGPGQYLTLQAPDPHSKMTLPYIYIRTKQGDLVPWVASQTDLLGLDWSIAIP